MSTGYHEGKFELLQHGNNDDLKGENSYSYQLSSGQKIPNSKTVKDLGFTIDESPDGQDISLK